MTDSLLRNYTHSISTKFSHEETSEMGYRTDFELLLKGIFESIKVTRFDHDARAEGGNKPDFVVVKGDVPILYIETKDIGVSLDRIEKSEQMTRYFGYANLVLTDYIEFRFYRNGIKYIEPIIIADHNKHTRTIRPLPDNFENLVRSLIDFTQSHKEPIKSGSHLAKVMGGKAQRIRDNIRRFLHNQTATNTQLLKIYETIEKLLVHHLSIDSFADMYAQTLVYGLFVARFYDETQSTFSRQEARDLIPKSNPLLQHFFDHILGTNFDDRLEHIVGELCEVFSHADVEKLMQEYYQKDLFGNERKGPDPVIHFYEDFLSEYDPVLRKKMGAYYTPLPVVEFIVKSVDEILKRDFGLSKGLADTSRLPNGKHRVQVLDPATGTGTFISAVIRHIYANFVGQEGRWYPYVLHDLLPRIHGFELMMAPYTIAHLKLGLAFKKTGFKYFNDRRLGIYLTNSLEEANTQKELYGDIGFAGSIAEESKAASLIKNQTPIMVVIGNPPYSGESSNASYKENDAYKIEPGGGKLQERNSKWLNDDYVKFIRFAESMIEKMGEGIVAMITPHGYIDNPTFRGMRWHLMKTFDEIYVLDLHGNANKQERSLDGSEDKNVFDIKTGVAIMLAVKKKESDTDLAKIFQADLFGKRTSKYRYLNEHTVGTVEWIELAPSAPGYEWVKRDEIKLIEYNKGFAVNELFPVSSVGIVTSRDGFVIDTDRQALARRIQDFLRCESPQEAKAKYNLRENDTWKVADALKHEFDEKNIIPITYRPFDTRFIYYHDDFIERPRKEVMNNLKYLDNVGIGFSRSVLGSHKWQDIQLIRGLAEFGYMATRVGNGAPVAPAYIYSNQEDKSPNINSQIFERNCGLINNVTVESLIAYIYAVLHSPRYREKYQHFLKANFPRVPYPTDKHVFERLARLGQELRELHLLESPRVNNFITTYPESGTEKVEVIKYIDEKVFINDTQYFGGVPEVAWNFWIGGYQPAQKWLKDRKGRTLNNEDIEHYQKIIVALAETNKIMGEIDKIGVV